MPNLKKIIEDIEKMELVDIASIGGTASEMRVFQGAYNQALEEVVDYLRNIKEPNHA